MVVVVVVVVVLLLLLLVSNHGGTSTMLLLPYPALLLFSFFFSDGRESGVVVESTSIPSNTGDNVVESRDGDVLVLILTTPVVIEACVVVG